MAVENTVFPVSEPEGGAIDFDLNMPPEPLLDQASALASSPRGQALYAGEQLVIFIAYPHRHRAHALHLPHPRQRTQFAQSTAPARLDEPGRNIGAVAQPVFRLRSCG